jgi:hypothetical protein
MSLMSSKCLLSILPLSSGKENSHWGLDPVYHILNVANIAEDWFISSTGRDLPLQYRVQTRFRAHPASYLIATEDSFPWDKATGV